METTNLADAKARLSELVDKAAAGEPQVITKRGKPMAKLVAIEPEKKKPVNVAALEAFARSLSTPQENPVEFMRRFRDDERY
jgi:prevent-host-death family protein